MKYNNLRAFEKHLESSSPSHFTDIYLIIAKEDFVRREALESTLRFLIPAADSRSLSLRRLNGESLQKEELCGELDSLFSFGGRRVVVINQVDELKEPIKKWLQTYFTKPNRTLYLVMTASSLTTTSEFYKKAEKMGVIAELNQPQSPWEREKFLGEWLKDEARVVGKQLDSAASQLMLQQLGTDQMQLHQELEKLICYTGERTQITTQDVAEICIKLNLETIWQLGDAVLQRNVGSAMRIGRSLLEEGGAVPGLLRQIRSVFQREYQIASILANGEGPEGVTRAFSYLKGNLLQRHIQMAQQYGLQAFKKGLIIIDQIEVESRNSATSPEILMELLLYRLAGKPSQIGTV